MTPLQNLCTEILEKTERPHDLPWRINDDEQVESAEGVVFERPRSLPLSDFRYLVTAANNAERLAKIVLVLSEALEFYSKGGDMSLEPVKILEIKDLTKVPFQTLTIATKTARDALQKAEEIANEK